MSRIMLAAIVAASLVQPAMAGVLDGWVSPGVQGTWSTKEGCEWLNGGKKPHPDAKVLPRDFDQYAYLRDGGLEGYEWSCSFVHRDQDGYGNIVATASCTAEGDGWPDLFLIQRDYKSGWRLINRGADGKTHITLFPVKCDRP